MTALRILRTDIASFKRSVADRSLRANPLSEDLRSLHSTSTRQHFARNEVVFEEGDAVDRFYKVVSGTVRLCRHTASGRRHIGEFAMAGDLFGLSECPSHSMAAEAVTAVIVATYKRSSLEDMAAENPGVRANLCSLLSANLLAARAQLFVLGCQSAKERLASFLLHLAGRAQTGQGEVLDLPMGRLDIADHLGLTIETVCRALTTLKIERSIIVPNAHQLILSNVAALRALATDA